MPEQQSAPGRPIVSTGIDTPFETPVFVFGVGGLNLVADTEKLQPGQYSILTNVYYDPGSGKLTGRSGLTNIATTGGLVAHSVIRMNDPEAGNFTRVWGVDSALYIGASGALTQIDAGYSGDPLTLLPHRPPLSGDPWTFVADSDRMRKVRADGLDLEIGLPAPTVAATTTLAAENKTMIATITASDGTNSAAWTPNAGTNYSDPPVDTDVPTGGPTAGEFTLNPGAALDAKNGYWSFFGIDLTRNLDLVGALPATDDDIIHLICRYVPPWMIAEFRLYFVVSSVFSTSVLPGTETDVNDEFYVKSFRPEDFTDVIGKRQSQITTAETARIKGIRQEALNQQSRLRGFAEVTGKAVKRANSAFMAQRDPARSKSAQAGGAAAEFVEFGKVGIPLRRGDFQRFGGSASRNWSTVTGLILYIQAANGADEAVAVTLADIYLTGGRGPDTMDPASQSYDYRYTNYDPRTGAEGNPSPIMAESLWQDSLRRGIIVDPAAFGDSAIRQRFYRRGGTFVTDWGFAGVNTSDGGTFTDNETDTTIEASATLEIDHFQPVATVDDAGTTVLAQPVPILFGPVNGMLFALGDPHRPGHLYACIPDEPDHWPPDLVDEVCSPSEELMSGCVYGGQPYVFSRDRGYTIYPNLSGGRGITSAPSACQRGLASRWGLAVGMGAMFIVATDGIYATGGGPESCLSDEIEPLFRGESVHGLLPINLTVPTAIRLTVYRRELWFGYQDTGGERQVLILCVEAKQWRHATFSRPNAALYAETTDPDDMHLILGENNGGDFYTNEGDSDDGDPIEVDLQTRSEDYGRPREEKLLGDQILDLDSHDIELTITNSLNGLAVTNNPQTLTAAAGRKRAILDSFYGDLNGPQRARSVATRIQWSASTTPPELYQVGTSVSPQPDLTINRVTTWDDLGHPDECYVSGITLDCDTGGITRSIIIERDFNGVISTIATLDVNHDGRHKKKYTWAAVPTNMVRIRPDDQCLAWLLYRADWIFVAEPPRIAGWDIHFENKWDQYYTGLDLYCDTNGQTKTIVVEVDGVILTNPETGAAWWNVTANGRRVVHLTLPWGRGHVFHFTATDLNPGLLYDHRWHLIEEPSEQANWNQPFTILGTQADKYLKGVVFEIDTFNEVKDVAIEVDGVTSTTIQVQANGRSVVQVSFPQILGRVFRFFPSDFHPSRLYTIRPIFDEEPFALTRWETQQVDHGMSGFHYLVEGMITLKSTADVTLDIEITLNQATGAVVTNTYVIPSTGGQKIKRFVPMQPRNGILYKYILTSAEPFWLYREETQITVQNFLGGEPVLRQPFGNDDLDPTRGMTNATIAAARSGGSA